METDEQTFQVIGAAMEVHKELGPTHRDLVYRTALAAELRERGIPVQADLDLSFDYKSKRLTCVYIPFNLVCFDDLLVEVKAVPKLVIEDEGDLRADLEEANFDRGLLLNFAKPRLEIKRVPRVDPKPPAPPPAPPKLKPAFKPQFKKKKY